ncbi:MAG: response regulator [Bacteroidota bacterium]
MRDTVQILLIEDDNDDIELIQDALGDNGVSYQLKVIKDGGEVAGYLETANDIPDIIVMDFNLPKVHGREILKHIKRTDHFKTIPLLILTTSSSQDDIDYSYKEGANRYLIKPTTASGIRNIVDVIKELAG